jgi:guanyl-specific ribonuclease Sa
MPRDASGTHYASTQEEGSLYLPQVSYVVETTEKGVAIYSVCFMNLHEDAKAIILKLKKGETVRNYPQDGTVHRNREGNYPKAAKPYYEYRVEPKTRIREKSGKVITGSFRILHRTDTNEFYYTGFHYKHPHKVVDIP